MSHLESLIREFGISSKQLANYLSVDCSLVSKWKSGKRKISSEYGHRIAELFLKLDAKNKYTRINQICGFDISSDHVFEEQIQKLEYWILSAAPVQGRNSLEQYLPANTESGSFYAFYGEEGKRSAVNIFLEYILGCEEKTTLWLYGREDNKWFDDEDFIKSWQEKNIQIVQNHHNINVIHPIDRRLRQVANSLFCWLPIHLVGDARAYYIPQYLTPDIKETIFLAEDQVVIIGISSDRYTKKSVTYLTTNKAILQNCSAILQDIFSTSHNLFEHMGFEQDGKFFTQFRKVIADNHKVFYFSGAPILYMLSLEMLEKLLAVNDLTEEMRRKCQIVIGQMSEESLSSVEEKPFITYVIQIGQLRELLQMDFVMMRFLSHCVGFPVYAPKELFRDMMRMAAEKFLVSDGFEILLTDRTLIKSYDKVALCIKEKHMACIVGTQHHTEEGACALVTTEDFTIAALYYSCQQFVESHSPNQREKETVYRDLLRLIEENT